MELLPTGPSRRALVAGALGAAALTGGAIGAGWRAGLFQAEQRVGPVGTTRAARAGVAGAARRSAGAASAAQPAPDPAAVVTANTGIAVTTSPLAFEIDTTTGLRAVQPADGRRAAGTAGSPGMPAPPGRPAPPQPAPVAEDVTPELVLSRVTYGATPALRAEIKKLGIPAWLGRQLAPEWLPDPEGDAVAAMYPSLARSPQSLWVEYEDDPESHTDAARDLQAAHLGRAIWSRRQLFEVMVGCWADRFTLPVTIDNARLTRADFDRTVLRRHALGRFEDLLITATYHPAMLTHLNLAGSAGTTPNENFARELLDLHTVGAGVYSEEDVRQAARLLTGLVLTPDTTVTYEPARHAVGAVKILGFRHANADPAGGPVAVRAFLGYLARHPATARSVATQLARRFVSDAPSADLVTTLAAVYLDSDTEIGPVLRALFAHPEFGASAGAKLRRPMEHAVAVARAIGLQPSPDAQALVDLVGWLGSTGHVPFAWTGPGGYPDVAEAWQSPGQALAQLKLANAIIHGVGPRGFGYVAPETLLATPGRPSTAADISSSLTARLFGRAPTATELAAVTTLLSGTAFTHLPARSQAQREATASAAVLLVHSPAFLTR
ncbi:MAG TPA: DUF1800 domain-containing protein [Kineosporiaceae bacterium]